MAAAAVFSPPKEFTNLAPRGGGDEYARVSRHRRSSRPRSSRSPAARGWSQILRRASLARFPDQLPVYLITPLRPPSLPPRPPRPRERRFRTFSPPPLPLPHIHTPEPFRETRGIGRPVPSRESESGTCNNSGRGWTAKLGFSLWRRLIEWQ